MNKIEILVGMIASSKSTYSARRAKEGALIVNADSIVTMIHGGDYTLYDEKLKSLYREIETAIIEEACYNKRDIVIDRTCLQKKTRYRYLSQVDHWSYEYKNPYLRNAIVFYREDPEIHAERRFNADNRGRSYEYWLKVAKIHYDQWEEPTLDEGFDEIIKI